MILIDFSGIAIATVAVNKVNDEQMLRHMMLNSIRMYRTKFKKDYENNSKYISSKIVMKYIQLMNLVKSFKEIQN